MWFYTSTMALSIKSDEADRLARELASVTGESLTDAVTEALRERLGRERALRLEHDLDRRLDRLVAEIAAMPILDDRPADEILGYDEHGLPT
jgi:antitoxin VapB